MREAPPCPFRGGAKLTAASVHEIGDNGRRVALCAHSAETVDELSLTLGDIVIELEPADEMGWCFGKDDKSKSEGYYPCSYVQPVGLFL